jgi:ribosomal protein L18
VCAHQTPHTNLTPQPRLTTHRTPHTHFAQHLHHAVVHVCRAYVQAWQRTVLRAPRVLEAAEQAAKQAAEQAAKNAKRAELENTELIIEEREH